MSVHLVLSHPLTDSLNARLACGIEANIRARGLAVDRLDLYASGFEPALTAEERRAYYGAIRPGNSPTDLQRRLTDAQHLVLVFPTWWFAPPAMLKGWFERVWAPGIAFEQGTPIRPLLTNLKSILVVTTLGSPFWFDVAIARQPVKQTLRAGLFTSCAPQARFRMLSLHSAENVDAARVARFESRIAKTIATLM
ncbi:NAD(P)H-dependent oxidoreductase [Devosia sp. SD17-2]|jgi:NAD(P)H dehydrogenase (quinone)|uniref:NAD(P)H-dependent oxidoreductase n=1 Tax=Devosia sp. SD17-2 TaxID=2976459 RepID=UPI0023D842A6|nr:NAD(P)H-dependent oxidoreductase [Devosia sp. SD17-2]WEJ33339.1 NAD(P)H-dependent oxidoreductase [Devosia sp. SD17-2]